MPAQDNDEPNQETPALLSLEAVGNGRQFPRLPRALWNEEQQRVGQLQTDGVATVFYFVVRVHVDALLQGLVHAND